MNLSKEQQQFINYALSGDNVLVEACIGSGKTTAIQALCDVFPTNNYILYLTYNKLLKIDAKSKIKNKNVTVTNYHGFVYPYLLRNGFNCGISEAIQTFTENRLSIPRYDILIIDEYQDIELGFAEMLEYIKSTNPNMQIIMVGDMSQKIYDKTTLDVKNWTQKFIGNHIDVEFTQCFRLQPELAAKLGRVWGKTIIGVNPFCQVRNMTTKQITKYLSQKNPRDVLCLGSKTGPMTDVLNTLEEQYPCIYNKNTVYASIRNGDANIEPSEDTAIFTTFDSSKGMEKPICVIFDWDEVYWNTRSRKSDTDSDILKNIFCVAASRGKNDIIFVQSIKQNKLTTMLSEETLMTPVVKQKIKNAYMSEMFDFKFVEEITKAYDMLTVEKIHTSDDDIITINDTDGLIDLSPCIGIYQETAYFKYYNIDIELKEAFAMRNLSQQDLTGFTLEKKILKLVSLGTKQNRYCSQVKTPFITTEQHNRITKRLAEHFDKDDRVQACCNITLDDIEIKGICDVIKDGVIWELKFTHTLKPEHFLQTAMYLVAFNKPFGYLWNVRDNTLFKVTLDKNKIDAFKKQVLRIITKDRSKKIPTQNNTKFSKY